MRQTKREKVGGRSIGVRHDERLIASLKNWRLLELTSVHSPPWASVKLVRDEAAPKNVYRLGWNGERMAANRDYGKLVEHNPTVEKWVVASLRKWRPVA